MSFNTYKAMLCHTCFLGLLKSKDELEVTCKNRATSHCILVGTFCLPSVVKSEQELSEEVGVSLVLFLS